ncbi:MAG: trimeric intracellular cation channel family protein [Cyanobacteria bacterium P01_A01_bin.123]
MLTYSVSLLMTAVFSITGVLAAARKSMDLFSIIVIGMVTALGGGTVRDILMDTPVFWLHKTVYLWVALGAAIATFWGARLFNSTYRLLLYLDALGVALFSVQALSKALALKFSIPVAIVMSVLTGIGGGLIRDILTDRQTLLMSRELYATPIMLGCTLYGVMLVLLPNFAFNHWIGFMTIFGLRAAAISWKLCMPNWLTYRDGTNG